MTERQSTGSTPLEKMIKEVYDTKIRMKKVLETDVDDFEQYPVLTWNKLALRYNQGISAGWNNAWHQFYPDHKVTKEEYEHLLLAYRDFTPSTPQYSAETDIKNLVIIMKDNYRIRMELKDALRTTSNEFVTYPDICEAGVEGWYKEAYDIAYKEAYNKAFDASIGVPIIVWQNGKISMYNGSTFENTTIYYWIDGQSGSRVMYTQPFTVSQTCTVYGVIEYQGRMGKIVTRYIDLDTDYSEEPLKLWLADDNASNDNKLIFTVYSYPFESVDPWVGFYIKLHPDDPIDSFFYQEWTKDPDNPRKFQITLKDTLKHIYVYVAGGYLMIESLNKNNGGKINASGRSEIFNDCCIEDAQYLTTSRKGFKGCNSLIYTHPINIDASNIEDLSRLYEGCSSLNQITCKIYEDYGVASSESVVTWDDYGSLPTFTNWVNGVADKGVFIKNKGWTLPRGVNGIPNGWKIIETDVIDNTITQPTITFHDFGEPSEFYYGDWTSSYYRYLKITSPENWLVYYTNESVVSKIRQRQEIYGDTEVILYVILPPNEGTFTAYTYSKKDRNSDYVSETVSSTYNLPWPGNNYIWVSAKHSSGSVMLSKPYSLDGVIKYYRDNNSSSVYEYNNDWINLYKGNHTLTAWVEPYSPITFELTFP